MIKNGVKTSEFAATFSLLIVTAMVALGLITQTDAAEFEQLLILAIVAASGFFSTALAVYQYIAQRTALKETALLSQPITTPLTDTVQQYLGVKNGRG